MRRIYWDTAAGTPLDKRVFEKMKPFMMADFGNPSSIHQEGLVAKKAVEEAREKIAQNIMAHADEIIFTSGGTESDNLAILGLVEMTTRKHLIATAIEHKAVLEPCRYLQKKKGYKLTLLPVDKNGQVNLKELKENLNKDTFLVSVMLANNEIGSIQPLKEVLKIVRHFRKENNTYLPYVHTDACQAPRFLDLNVEKLGVDLLSFNGSKIYGPKGVGALFVRRGVLISPVVVGGGQERGLRSGTLNVAGIVGLAESLAICQKERDKERVKLEKIQKKLINDLKKIHGVIVNGGEEDRLPNNVNFSVVGLEGEQLVIELDAKGFAVSSGSACSHDGGEGSYSIKAIGGSESQASGAVRISLSRESSLVEVPRFIKALKEIIIKYQKVSF